MTYNIIEIANTHAGDFDYLCSLIREFEEFQGEFGIKMQVFHADGIALKDFDYYQVYKELYFYPEQWQEVIKLASATKDVWIDVFDPYSAEIIAANFDLIRGIKFQASTLHNFHLIELLAQMDWSKKSVIVNVSGYPIDAVQDVVERIQKKLPSRELILQIGFQKYPSALNDSGFCKIAPLKERLDLPLSFADHLPPDDEDSALVPLSAMMMGVEYIEKHVRLSGTDARYDHFSSLDIGQYRAYFARLQRYQEALQQPFINDNEAEYLRTSLQIPVLNKRKAAGSLIHFDGNLHYKRTLQEGMNIVELKDLQRESRVLAVSREANTVLNEKDFRPAKIGAIVACRMKSSRLKRKQVLQIGSLSATELCFRSVLKFARLDCAILATSTVDEDAELRDHTYSSDVIFFQGQPVDVMQRYLDAAEENNLDIVVRVTGDMPYASSEIYAVLLDAHLDTGADYTRASKVAVGTGVEIFNTNALRKAKEMFPSADLSEYMTYYFTNNPDHFVLQDIQLPDDLIRDYRLTLDYDDDLVLFRKIEAYMDENGLQKYGLSDIFAYLDQHPEIVAINSARHLVYEVDQELIERINAATTYRH